MTDRRDAERRKDLEKALTDLYHRPRLDPRFSANLERNLQARLNTSPASAPSRLPGVIRLLASSARMVAWAGGALLFFLVVLWTVRHLAPQAAVDLPAAGELINPAVEDFQPTAAASSPGSITTPTPNAPASNVSNMPEDAILFSVREGDTILEISNLTGVPVETIRQLNALQNGDILTPGRQLVLGFIEQSLAYSDEDSAASTYASTPEAMQPPDQITVKPEVALANLRAGPGTNFEVVGGLRAGMHATAIGRSQDGEWIQLGIPEIPDSSTWIYAALVTYSGQELALVASPPTPPAPTPLPPELSPFQKPARQILLTLADSDQTESLVDASQGELFIVYASQQNPNRMRLGRLSLTCLLEETSCEVIEVPGYPAGSSSPMVWSPDGAQAVLYDEVGAKFYTFDPTSSDWRSVELNVRLDSPDLVWSPGGKWIAARVPGPDANHRGIILIRHDGLKTRTVAGDLSGDLSPLGWLTENILLVLRRQLDFESGNLAAPALFKINIDNGTVQAIDTNQPMQTEAVMEPSNAGLTFSLAQVGGEGLYSLNLKNGKSTAYGVEGTPLSWSPDGRWLVLKSWKDRWERLFILRADNGNLRSLFPWHGQVLWFPSSKHILVTTFNDRLLGGDDQSHYYLVSVPEGIIHELILNQADQVDRIWTLSVRPGTP